MNTHEHYSYQVRWSAKDQEFVGTVAEFPSLSWLSADPREAFDGIRTIVMETLEDMAESGEVPPMALADRNFSGRFLVRITPDLHRRLTLEATEQHVSLNHLAAQRLAQ